ncbi:MAG: DUF3576 domain-containing protein [Rhodobacteraceae bacterium]|jgi:hypothetical protein|nr:DUF3576 domain-containing protein [Paracoccaceae bacterium]
MAAAALLSACGGQEATQRNREAMEAQRIRERGYGAGGESIFNAFNRSVDPNVTVAVNQYLWYASLDVLSFLPIEAVDPYTGVIVMGYGAPPGGGRAYRATVFVRDPALDARSLSVALATRNGPVAAETQRAVEDAILSRARQLRVQAGNL